ncbi:MAG: translocation/assembly module TamB domain-containing protein [Spirochaetes bacterium]|nr:translocation/assembly module TamB domain-containing protein [Spirochaetota bacterium]
MLLKSYRNAVILIPLALFLGVITFFLSFYFERRINGFKEAIISNFEGTIDRTITFQTISPSILQHIEIRNLHIADVMGKYTFQADRFRIRFSLLRMLFSNKHPVSMIYLENLTVNLNTESDKNIIDIITNSLIETTGNNGSSRPIEKLTVRGRNISINTAFNTGIYKFNRVFLDLAFDKDEVNFFLRSNFSAENFFLNEIIGSFAADIRVEGFIDRVLQNHNYNFEIRNFRTNFFNLRRQNFNIQYQNGRIVIRKTKDRAPLDFIIEYDTLDRVISASARFENYSPAENLISFTANRNLFSLFKPKYSGRIDLVYSLDCSENRLTYSGNILSSADSLHNNLSLSFSGDGNFINFTTLLLATERGTIAYTGLVDLKTFLPAGVLTLTDFQHGSRKGVNSQLVFNKDGEESVRASIHIEYGEKVIDIAELRVSHNNRRYSFHLYLETEAGGSLSYSGVLSFGGQEPSFTTASGYLVGGREDRSVLRNPGRQHLESTLVFRNFGLDYITDFFLPEFLTRGINPASNFYIDASIRIATNFETYTIASSNIKIYEASNIDNFISAAINIDEKRISLTNMLINLRNYRGEGKFEINRTNQWQYDLSSRLVVNNQIYNFSGSIHPGAGFIITGDYHFYLSLFQSDTRAVFSVFSERLPLILPNNTRSYLSLRVNGYSDNDNNYRIFLRNNTLTGIQTPHTTIDLSLSAYIVNNNVRITRITYRDGFSRLNGIGDIVVINNREVYGWTRISDARNREKYLFSININDDTFLASINFDNSLMQRIGGQQVAGHFSGQVTYKNQAGFQEIRVATKTQDGLLLGTNFFAEIDLYISKNEISINKLELEYGTNRIVNGGGFIDGINRNYLFTSGFISRRSAANAFESNIIINGELSRTHHANNLFNLSLSQFVSGRLLLGMVTSDLNYDFWQVAFVNAEEYFSISGGPENSINAHFDKAGEFVISLQQPLPIAGLFSGTIDEGNIQATFANISLNLDLIGLILSNPLFNPIGGVAKGTINVSGRLADPDFFGELSIEGARVVSSLTPQAMGPFDTYAVFDGRSFSIPETLVRMQRSRINFQMDAAFDRWIPGEFIVMLRTPPGATVWIRERFGTVDIDGYASGEVVIENTDVTTVTGRLFVTKTTIALTEENGEEIYIQQDDLGGLVLDLELLTGPGIEFFWPARRLPMLRTTVAAGQRLNIYRNTVTNAFSLTGDLRMVGGEIYYFGKSFFLREGMIAFDEDEEQFDPHVTLRAELRERTADNRNIRIFLVANNSPLSRFSPRFESNPPMSETDIYILLGQGIFDQFGGEDITLTSALMGAGSYGTQFLGFMRPFETGVRNFLNLDFFMVRTHFLQRAFLYDIFNVRNVTYREIHGLNTYLDNTSIFMGRYFGEYFFLQGLVRLSTLGFDTPRNSRYDIPDFMGMYIETDISLEIDTPLALINLNFYPQITNFYDSLLDTTIQLSWRFSF